MRTKLISYLIAIHICFVATAQNDMRQLTDFSLKDLADFQAPPANWLIIGNVSASFTDTLLKSSPGTGVLVNRSYLTGQSLVQGNLSSALEHGDLYLELDFMLPQGSNSGIFFQSRYEIQLFDSWGVKNPTYKDCGAIYERWDSKRPERGFEGHAPLKNACFAPGLWQHLEVVFEAPKFNNAGKKIQSACFRKVILNGVVIHENILLSGPTRASAADDEKAKAPLMFQGDHGFVAFRNIKYAEAKPWHAGWKSLSYNYYEGKFESGEDALKSKPVRSGPAKEIDSRLADAKTNFVLSFNGSLVVPEDDTYVFYMRQTGTGYLQIDDKVVIPPQLTTVQDEDLQGRIRLTAGEHRVVAWCNKQIDWAEPGFGIFIGKQGSKIIPLHTNASLPQKQHAPLIEVEPRKEPELIRSYLKHGTNKLTHVISVGDPAGVHYSYDLKRGAVVSIWKGDFLNTTDMWYERGEPQTASPMGATINFKALAAPVANKDLLEDSLTELKYAGYRLNNKRTPVFYYKLGGLQIIDSIEPWDTEKGLIRTLHIEGNSGLESIVFQLAKAENFTDLGNGIYGVNNQQYFLRVLSKASLSIRTGVNGVKTLVAETPAKTVRFATIW